MSTPPGTPESVKQLHNSIAELINLAVNAPEDPVDVAEIVTMLTVMTVDSMKTFGLEPFAMLGAFAAMVLHTTGAPIQPTIPKAFAGLVDQLAEDGNEEAIAIQRAALAARLVTRSQVPR